MLKIRDFTPEEKILWFQLRNSSLGYRFRRQHSIGNFIVDFYCPAKKLVIELDGNQHLENKEYDEERKCYFENLGIKEIRFWNSEIDNNLKEVMKNNDCPCLSALEQDKIRDDDHFQEWISLSNKSGWEGLILRADETYKGKRSKDMLKWKTFHDAEYEVKDIEFGPFRYVLNGQEAEEEMLSGVTIEHKGYNVRVGSGFSIDQRQYFYRNPKEILGKIIRVNYFEESKNQDGGLSLRFPTLAYIYGDSRDI
jgi:very-short-patch-repair endonuclease